MVRTAQGNDFELILMVKMETRHAVEGSFGSEQLCSYGGLKSQDVEILCAIFAFFWKNGPLR